MARGFGERRDGPLPAGVACVAVSARQLVSVSIAAGTRVRAAAARADRTAPESSAAAPPPTASLAASISLRPPVERAGPRWAITAASGPAVAMDALFGGSNSNILNFAGAATPVAA